MNFDFLHAALRRRAAEAAAAAEIASALIAWEVPLPDPDPDASRERSAVIKRWFAEERALCFREWGSRSGSGARICDRCPRVLIDGPYERYAEHRILHRRCNPFCSVCYRAMGRYARAPGCLQCETAIHSYVLLEAELLSHSQVD